MKYRRFGRTELKIPVFSCGGMRFNQTWEQLPLDEVERQCQENVERIVERAFELGVNHFETARGYGTSEVQLGPALERLPREEILIQTKVPSKDTPEEFEETLKTSFENLKIDYADMIAIHGVNDGDAFDSVEPCLEVLERWRDDGRIRHIGFSSHDDGDTIVETINTGRFDYVNLHYYYIARHNIRAVEAAGKQDMGVFIISPNDKGGRLYDPPEKLSSLTAPLSPMQFNDLFCLATEGVHTLSLGAAKPADFDEHIAILEYLDGDGAVTNEGAELAAATAERLDNAMRDALGGEWVDHSLENLPKWNETPGEINIPVTIRLWNLAKGLDMLEYAKMRYKLLGEGGRWFPGQNALEAAKLADSITTILRERHARFPGRTVDVLSQAHKLLS